MTSIDTPTGWVRRLVAVIIAMMATTAALVGASAPAGAAACSSSSGVSVIVDFTGATGGLQSACVANGADRPGDEVIASAGFALTWVTRQPGFICRVNGVPADDPCVNTPPPTAYWGVFWSDGRDGAWHYADVGVSGLQVPDGGYIGLAWQTGTRRVPGQAATAHPAETATPTTTPTTTAPAPTSPTASGSTSGTTQPTTTATTKPTKNPTTKPTTKPTSTPTTQPTTTPTSTGTGTTSATPTTPTESSTTDPSESATTEPLPSSSTTESPTTSATTSPSESAATESSTSTPSETPTPTEPRSAEEESSRVPTWLTVTILGMLLLAIGMSTVAARRRTRH